MATYYVRPDGSNTNTGTGPATNQAWQTIQKALGATGIASGDTVYIAPGRYNEFITVGMTSATATTSIIGDVGASQFPGVSAGVIRITSHNSDSVNATGTALITATSKNYLYWQNIYFETANNTNNAIASCRYWTFDRCAFVCAGLTGGGNFFTNAAGVPLDLTITKCIFNCAYGVFVRTTRHTSVYDIGITISDCLCIGVNSSFQPFLYLDATGTGSDGNGIKVYNCTLIGTGFFSSVTNTTHPMLINNVVAIGTTTFFQGSNSSASTLTNCRYPNSAVSNVTVVNSSSTGVLGVDFSYSLISSLSALAIGAPYTNSILLGAGATSGAPATDIYNRAWASGVDIGAITNKKKKNTSFYYPTERNASTITIAPGSTSQSIELYLGATGLTYNTSGLSAYYIRNRSTTTSISLVTQTASGAWTSGGFAEISSANAPGLYRLDIPNAALASGSDEVTIVVRGASGTNGAVVTINLRSTKAQLDPTQTIGTTTVGDALNSANVGGVGKWSISGDLLYLYAADGSLTKKLRVKNLRIDV